MLIKKLIHFDPRTIEEHTVYTTWILSSPYSVKFSSSLWLTEVFRNTRSCGEPWSSWKGHSFLQRFSEVQKSTAFPHETQQTHSVQLKAVPQSDLKALIYILKISQVQIEQEKSHTHTHTHPCPRSMRRDKRNSWNPGVARMCGHFHVSK
jgi:hypothetical protein